MAMAKRIKTMKSDAPSGVRDVSESALAEILQSGDTSVIFELLISNARQLAATGKGTQLIKLAPFMGDESESGLAIRKGFTMLGHVVNLEFDVAEAMAHELLIEEKNNPVFDFLEKITNYVFAICNFARGNLVDAKLNIHSALSSPLITSDLGDTDKINLYRMLCAICMVESDEAGLLENYQAAKKIAENSQEGDFGVHLMAIKSMVLHEEGQFSKAFDLVKNVIANSDIHGYTGINSALDCKYILARCYIAFGKPEAGIEILEEIKEYASNFKIFTWYVAAEGLIIRSLIELCQTREALNKIIELREFLSKFPKQYDLAWLTDVAELFVRYRLNDYHRAKEIATRTRQTYYVKQVIQAVEATKGKEVALEEVMALDESTPRKKIWKYMYLSEFPATKNFAPKEYMRKALVLGEETGARDIFIRQSNYHHNLIHEIASEEKSYFLEELSRDCIKRVNLKKQSQVVNNESLTSREIQVLKHLATGKSINQIGKELHISQNTMKTHLRNIYRKLEVDGRKSAVVKASDNFLI